MGVNEIFAQYFSRAEDKFLVEEEEEEETARVKIKHRFPHAHSCARKSEK